jgi:hypothetical protein
MRKIYYLFIYNKNKKRHPLSRDFFPVDFAVSIPLLPVSLFGSLPALYFSLLFFAKIL